MFRVYMMAAVIMCGMVTEPLRAQQPISVGIAGGVAMPVGSIGDVSNPNPSVSASLRVNPKALPFALQFDGSLDKLSYDASVTGVSGGIKTWSLTANGIFALPVNGLYAVGGMGLYNLRASRGASSVPISSDREQKFGINMGMGVQVPIKRLNPFVEIRYHNVFNSEIKFVPVVLGLRF